MNYLRNTLLLFSFVFSISLSAKDTPNSRQARRIFNEVYEKTFGNEGSTLHYAVNIIGIFKTEGTIWYKNKKSKFVDERYNSFCDGTTYWLVERKKQTVHIHDAQSEKRDKYATKFVFYPENFIYSIKDMSSHFELTLKAKPHTKGIKLVRVLLDKRTHNPLSLRVKLGIIWTTVKISNYKCGGISESIFDFPKDKYKNYKVIDHRLE